MFDFHAHPGTDDKDAFITILQERELDHISKTSSIGLLPWLEGIEKERIEALRGPGKGEQSPHGRGIRSRQDKR